IVEDHPEVLIVTIQHLTQPQMLLPEGSVRAALHLVSDCLQLSDQALDLRLPLDRESVRPGLAAVVRASRPTGFRRQPLLDPCMNLSAHTAPIRRTCRSCRYASERTGSSSPGPAFVENGWRVFCEP